MSLQLVLLMEDLLASMDLFSGPVCIVGKGVKNVFGHSGCGRSGVQCAALSCRGTGVDATQYCNHWYLEDSGCVWFCLGCYSLSFALHPADFLECRIFTGVCFSGAARRDRT